MSAEFYTFSPKQLAALSWWCRRSPYCAKDGIICDGAVRSGKTLCLSLSFVAWSFYQFNQTDFALCGKTIVSLRRNLVTPLLPVLKKLGFRCKETISRNCIEITFHHRTNRFYLFGGRDEGAAALIQGVTLGGVLFDETALMPRSFVEQALARCSLKGSKYFFNCNPEHPEHWFYKEWIAKRSQKNVFYLHFKMEDNPSLAPEIRQRYRQLYSGVFYERFVEGRWTAPQGLVYPMFDQSCIRECPGEPERYYVSCDYGTVNPCSMGLWGEYGGAFYRLEEVYYDSRLVGVQRTDEEYYADLERLARGKHIEAVIVDPSAASFIQCIRKKGRFAVSAASNDVLNGIRRVCSAMKADRLFFSRACRDTLREFGLYCWDKGGNRDMPRKEYDHAMDDIRYFIMHTMAGAEDCFFVTAVERRPTWD